VDPTDLTAEILAGFESGEMELLSNSGVVYKNGRIFKHLGLIPVDPSEFASAEQLLQVGQQVKAAQAAALTATAVSTVVVVAVVVAATAYLAIKINKIQSTVDALSEQVDLLDQQDVLKQVSEYFGAVKSAQELLNSRAPQEQIARLALARIDRLAELRQQTLAYVRGLLLLMATNPQGKEPYTRRLRFVSDILDLIPAALTVERELCLVAGMPELAQGRHDQAAPQFRSELASFRAWHVAECRKLALGDGGFPDVLVQTRKSLESLWESPVHALLLDGFKAAVRSKATSTREHTELRESAAGNTAQSASGRSS
jgi:hypothetical protein